MDVEIAADPKRCISVTAPLWASARLSPACLIRNDAITRWEMIRKTGVSNSGCAANSTRSGMGNETTHCRTGTRGMT